MSNAQGGKKLKAIDLFCGCGGISAGLKMSGFTVIAGVDIEPKYMATFSHNFSSAKSLQLDLSQIAPQEFMDEVNIKSGQLDILTGGPPCQGFSKNVPRRNRYLDDPNNRLIKSFLDYCEAIKPRMVLMENVAEMKRGFEQSYTQEIISRLNAEGYTITEVVLNAADYGIPQRRRRAFFLANRFGLKFTIPPPTHKQRKKQDGQLDFSSLRPHVTVWEAIGDLPEIKHGEALPNCEYASAPLSDFQKLMRNGQKTVTNHVARRLKPTQYARLAALEPGQGHKDLPKHLQVKSGYSGAYGRLTKEMTAPTITRWVFHPGSGRWGHPVDTRLLTIREVARVQSFPDNFEFVGTYTQQAGQLGNAVPPLLVKELAESMLRQLEQLPSASSVSLRGCQR